MGGLQNRSGRCGVQEDLSMQQIEPRFSGNRARNHILYLQSLFLFFNGLDYACSGFIFPSIIFLGR
jgi:hypothetical protein